MSRLMSVALTSAAVRERRKSVTRRLGWAFLKPGERLTLCEKVQGRKRRDGTVEPLVRISTPTPDSPRGRNGWTGSASTCAATRTRW
jgi:hypothetical protein